MFGCSTDGRRRQPCQQVRGPVKCDLGEGAQRVTGAPTSSSCPRASTGRTAEVNCVLWGLGAPHLWARSHDKLLRKHLYTRSRKLHFHSDTPLTT
eukprot:7098070-Prymnesium_polylepis.1